MTAPTITNQTDLNEVLFSRAGLGFLPGVIVFDRPAMWHDTLTIIVGPFAHDGEGIRWYSEHEKELDSLSIKAHWEVLTNPGL